VAREREGVKLMVMVPCIRPGFRKSAALWLAFLAGSLLASARPRAVEDKDGAPAPPVTRGQRVFTCAHSFHAFVYPMLDEMARAAGIKDHQSVGASRIGGSRVIQHWNVPEEKNQAKAALRAGKVDVLTLSPIWLPDEGIEDFARLGFEHNSEIRVTVQEFWLPNDEYHPVYPLETRKKVDHDATRIDALREAQARYDRDIEDLVRGVNARLGKDAVVVVPVGQAATALREKIVAGRAPGLKAQWDLFRDTWGHPQPPLQVLDAYCHFAVIYRRSPVGLPLPAALAKAANLKDEEKAALNRLLQELAWDAVTHHPLTGLGAESPAEPAGTAK
jgi:hypothetical protein